MVKISHFGKFVDFCPLRNAFCPLDVPHEKNSGAASGRSYNFSIEISVGNFKIAHKNTLDFGLRCNSSLKLLSANRVHFSLYLKQPSKK